MRFDQIPQNNQITALDDAGQPHVFSSTAVENVMVFGVPFGKNAKPLNKSCDGAAITGATPGKALYIQTLITCAAAVYVYTDGAARVRGVAVYHAHTGMIPAPDGPMKAAYNLEGVPPAHVHVVFASSQSMKENPRDGIQTAASGLFTILAAGVPQANIRIVTGTGTFGANRHGDVGVAPTMVWPDGNLKAVLATAVKNATNDYVLQFPPGMNTQGIFGSGHNKAMGRQRAADLTASIYAARNDRQVLGAVENFLNGSYSYKDGSLKLLLVRRIYRAVRPLAVPNVTSANARATGTDLLSGIAEGRYPADDAA